MTDQTHTRESSNVNVKSLQSCPTLCDPIDGSPPGSAIPGILQARILEWVAISFSNAWKRKVKVKTFSRVRLLATPWTAAYQAPLSMDFPGKSTGVGCHCLLRKAQIGSLMNPSSLQTLHPQLVINSSDTRWRYFIMIDWKWKWKVSDSLRLHGLYSPWNSTGQNTGVGSRSLLHGIFPTQGSNPGLWHAGGFFNSWAAREAHGRLSHGHLLI